MRNVCERVYQEKNIEIIKCNKNYFLVTDRKRIKIGPLEGESYKSGICGCS